MTDPADPADPPATPDPPDEGDRRYPSTIGGAFYIVVLAAAVVAIAIVMTSDWRVGRARARGRPRCGAVPCGCCSRSATPACSPSGTGASTW